MSLKGKVAVVTGGSRGIGAAIAERLAQDGADVVITYGSSADKAEEVVQRLSKLGVKAKAVKADAKKPEDVAKAMDDIGKEFGRIDILVNNAGTNSKEAALSYEGYAEIAQVNVLSVVSGVLAAQKYMKEGAKIINISSILGERAIMPGIAPYNMSKFALIGLTRSWAHDYAARKITVNAVLPGPINTELNPEDDSDKAKGMTAMTALKRYGQPEEIASAVAYFAKDEAGYITGATLRVDGGSNA